ncbi:hypothetical protein [Bacillus sp. 1NLA3E]|uniref:hypothetical protein n=1 Tax=Bacillus sp. 1NLA3E TaxID=666686 RepID=UPI000247EAFC|nr:hypothetical protein [Bacillus sp. 1NLA3E]AGK53178.1 hypothetical protein B1NLA3E_07070 [Bacillus sp. 1NLA3E]
MIVINKLMDELTDISIEFNKGTTTKAELLIQLDLVIGKIEGVQLNMNEAPLDRLPERVQQSFHQLLFSAKFKATEGIKGLAKDSQDKRSYNAQLRKLLGNRLYFRSLYKTMKLNSASYINRNQLTYYTPNTNIFILGGNDND